MPARDRSRSRPFARKGVIGPVVRAAPRLRSWPTIRRHQKRVAFLITPGWRSSKTNTKNTKTQRTRSDDVGQKG
jgi:hypothetical protein